VESFTDPLVFLLIKFENYYNLFYLLNVNKLIETRLNDYK